MIFSNHTGCGGTLNNFETLEKCTEICCKNDWANGSTETSADDFWDL